MSRFALCIWGPKLSYKVREREKELGGPRDCVENIKGRPFALTAKRSFKEQRPGG